MGGVEVLDSVSVATGGGPDGLEHAAQPAVAVVQVRGDGQVALRGEPVRLVPAGSDRYTGI
jgi:hypothetical protein